MIKFNAEKKLVKPMVHPSNNLALLIQTQIENIKIIMNENMIEIHL